MDKSNKIENLANKYVERHIRDRHLSDDTIKEIKIAYIMIIKDFIAIVDKSTSMNEDDIIYVVNNISSILYEPVEISNTDKKILEIGIALGLKGAISCIFGSLLKDDCNIKDEIYYMKILKELISLHGKGKSTCSPEVSLVNHLASLDNERERKMTVISGRKCLESYERQDRSGLLARMLLESPIWFNPVVKLTWKRKVIKMKKITRKRYLSKNISSIPSATILNVKDIPSNRSLFQLAVSEPRTGETGYGLLPTPTAQEGFNSGKGEIFIYSWNISPRSKRWKRS